MKIMHVIQQENRPIHHFVETIDFNNYGLDFLVPILSPSLSEFDFVRINNHQESVI